MRILAIDPGPTQSGYVVIDSATCFPLEFGKVDNNQLCDMLSLAGVNFDEAVIEMVASYGMAVGAEVFETCVWIGRYYQIIADREIPVTRTYRLKVKQHLCHDSRAKDANISQALVDRFATGQPNHGKGTKAQPGFFYGFKADIWQSYALAVTHADLKVGVA